MADQINSTAAIPTATTRRNFVAAAAASAAALGCALPEAKAGAASPLEVAIARYEAVKTAEQEFAKNTLDPLEEAFFKARDVIEERNPWITVARTPLGTRFIDYETPWQVRQALRAYFRRLSDDAIDSMAEEIAAYIELAKPSKEAGDKHGELLRATSAAAYEVANAPCSDMAEHWRKITYLFREEEITWAGDFDNPYGVVAAAVAVAVKQGDGSPA